MGGVPRQRLVVGPHDRADVGLIAGLGARLALLHDLVADVDDGGLRLKVWVRVVPAHAPARTNGGMELAWQKVHLWSTAPHYGNLATLTELVQSLSMDK